MKIIPATGASALAQGVKELYGKGDTDYYLGPLVLVDDDSLPIGRIKDGDSVIFCCRRGEREIELTEAFTAPDYSHFERQPFRNLNFVLLTLYHEKFRNLPIAFAPEKFSGTLAETISSAGLKQLHLAESEKFAHVTFFLNGGSNQHFPGEDDTGIPSPRGVPFDQVPELSLPAVTDKVLEGISNKYDFIAVNFANGDVIGHTSNTDAKIRCAGAVDRALGITTDAAMKAGYVTLITADHGNLEELYTSDGSPHGAHTANPVPFIVLDPASSETAVPQDGKLADISPTVLSALGLAPSPAMDGTCLLPDYNWHGKRKVMLIILDGWGTGKKNSDNPIFTAETPVWDSLVSDFPNSSLMASGKFVGLKKGKPGNSEAGHINIGAGRVIPQDDVRLDSALEDGTFFNNKVFLDTILRVKKERTSLHLLGLLTEKSSHGSIEYPLALLKTAKKYGLEKVYLHIIFDGRSTQNGSAPAMLEELESRISEIGTGKVVSGIGRGLALDRDGDYEKIRHTFDLLVHGKGRQCRL